MCKCNTDSYVYLAQVQVNNYANFYDDARVNWSIMFTSAQDAEKFGKEVRHVPSWGLSHFAGEGFFSVCFGGDGWVVN